MYELSFLKLFFFDGLALFWFCALSYAFECTISRTGDEHGGTRYAGQSHCT